MTQHPVVRKTPAKSLLEGIDIIDSLPDERAFLENILIYIGHRPRVWIDPDLAGKQFHKPRSGGTGQAHAHPRLQYAISFRDNPFLRMETRAVERMGERARQHPG